MGTGLIAPKPGDTLAVTINGKEYLTVFDGNAIQRFPENAVEVELPAGLGQGVENLTLLAVARETGRITREDYMHCLMNTGCSVSHVRSVFHAILNRDWEEGEEEKSLDIQNPAWDS